MFTIGLVPIEFKFGPEILAIGHLGPFGNLNFPDRPTHLDVAWLDLVETPTDLALLTWRTRTTMFVGRDAEMAEVEAWATSSSNVSIRFIVGPGGAGKSRLAAEFCEWIKRRGWEAGFVDLRKPQSFLMRKEGTLLVIDYPEENIEAVGELLRDLIRIRVSHRVRVLFLTRRAMSDWQDVIFEANAMALVELRPVLLGDIDPATAHTIFHSAAERAAEAKGVAFFPPVSERALADWMVSAPENSLPLFLAVAGVNAAFHPSDETVGYVGRELVEALVQRELGRLRSTAGRLKLVNTSALANLVAVACISGPLPSSLLRSADAEWREVLGFPPGAEIETVAREAGLLVDGSVDSPKPDVIAASMLADTLRRCENPSKLLWWAIQARLDGALDRISRLSYDAEVVLRIGEPKLGMLLADAVKSHTDRCKVLVALLRRGPPVRLEESAIVAFTEVARVASNEVEKVIVLNNLSAVFASVGRYREALGTIEEAVRIRRQLVDRDPLTHERGLAGNLLNLSTYLAHAERNDEALEIIQEGVGIWRRLAATDPAGNESDLTVGLINLANRLSGLGRKRNALDVLEEAVARLRLLARGNPREEEPNLARSLNNMSNLLGEVGRPEDALAAIEEAVEIRRRFVEESPAKHEADLASSLNNLSNRLAELGRSNEALSAIEEAVRYWRRLASEVPARYGPDLGGGLNTLSNLLSSDGNLDVALQVIEEAVGICRGLVAINLGTHEWSLAMSLSNYSRLLSLFGRHEDALAAVEEAVLLYRRLAALAPGAYDVHLATTLDGLARELEFAGRADEAKAAWQEREAVRSRRDES